MRADASIGLRVVLMVAALPAFALGAVMALSPAFATRAAAALSGSTLELAAPDVVVLRLAGLHAALFGTALAVAACRGWALRAIGDAAFVLFAVRAAQRVACAEEMRVAFGTEPSLNLWNAAWLAALAIAFFLLRPRPRERIRLRWMGFSGAGVAMASVGACLALGLAQGPEILSAQGSYLLKPLGAYQLAFGTLALRLTAAPSRVMRRGAEGGCDSVAAES